MGCGENWQEAWKYQVERNQRLRDALFALRGIIEEKAPDTLWFDMITTAVDHIDNVLVYDQQVATR